MCDARLIDAVKERVLSRRGLPKGAAGATLAAGGLAAATRSSVRATARGDMSGLTHELHEGFPTFSGDPQFSPRRLTSFGREGRDAFELAANEHTGTHLDAPLHFGGNGMSVAEIPVAKLARPRAGRRRLERVAGLHAAPPAGSTVVVGAPRHRDVTGGSSRALAPS